MYLCLVIVETKNFELQELFGHLAWQLFDQREWLNLICFLPVNPLRVLSLFYMSDLSTKLLMMSTPVNFKLMQSLDVILAEWRVSHITNWVFDRLTFLTIDLIGFCYSLGCYTVVIALNSCKYAEFDPCIIGKQAEK